MDIIERFKGEFEAIEGDVNRMKQEAAAAATVEKDAKIAELEQRLEEVQEEAGRLVIDEIKRRLGIL